MKDETRWIGSVAVLVVVGLVGCSSSDAGSTGAGGTAAGTATGGAAGSATDDAGTAGSSAAGGGAAGAAGNASGGGGNAAGAGGSSAGGGGSDVPGACNALTNIGTVVTGTANPAAVPAMTGGMIADGTYVLVSAVDYGGHSADDKTHKRTISISGTTMQLVNSDDGGPDVHATFGIAPAGNELNDKLSCPPLTEPANTYTATTTSLMLLKSVSDDSQVETYTKQ